LSPFRRRKQDRDEEPLLGEVPGDDTPEGKKLKRKFLERLRGRIDRYRELGKQRRERWEDKIQRRESRVDAPPEAAYPSSYETVPGTARSVLSGADYLELEALIGYTIKHRAYFLQALTHRSYLQFVPNPALKSNERLEFLGDAVLNLVIAEYLYREFQTLPEGELTKLRSRLVSGAALVQHAHDIKLEKFLLLSNSAANALRRGSATLLADAYEAVIAAIYLDGGADAARDFIYRNIITHTRRDELMLSDTNYKSMLLEYVQARKIQSPRYVTVNEDGPNHNRTFSVEVLIENTSTGAGTGKSKKEAEQSAAKEALKHFGVLTADGEPNVNGEDDDE
jgi:ribonuclease-3